jgi:hypothetical protein
MWYIHTMEYSSAIKKNGSISFAEKWVELEITMLSEINQTQKDKCCMFSLICGIWVLGGNHERKGGLFRMWKGDRKGEG